jgi:D-alanyl-D-alanine dipeptidase
MSYLLDYKGWKKLNEAKLTVNKLNGNLPDSALVKISVEPGDAQGVHKLNPQAAADYEKMRAAAKANNIVWGITDSYRTFAVQDSIFDWDKFSQTGQRKKKGTNIAAAYPGTSNHGYGSAVDLNLFGPGVYGVNQKTKEAKKRYDANYSWLQQNAGMFGFSELKGEPWHWDHKSSAQQYAQGGEVAVDTQAVSISKMIREKNPLLANKLELFERGNLIINSEAKAAGDVILFIKAYLPKEYKDQLGAQEVASPVYSDTFKNVISKFQTDNNLPRTDGAFDISTYNKLFKDAAVVGGKYDAVLIGGLDNRKGDLNIDDQVKLFKKGYGEKRVKEFRYNAPTAKILEFLKQNPNIPVYMFSAGCAKALDLAKSESVDKQKLFIIEPYSADAYTKDLIKKAVEAGVPAKNVFVGEGAHRGQGTVSGESSAGGADHWSALSSVGKITSNIA